MENQKDLKTSEDYNNYNTRGAGEKSSHPNNTQFCEKLMIFIDGSNLFQGAKKSQIKIDFKKLIDFLTGGYNLVRVYYYTGIPTKKTSSTTGESEKYFEEKFNKQKAFLDSLAFDLNFDVVTKPLASAEGKFIEKGIDVRIASDIIWHGLSNNYDSFVLISGDKDLMDCLIRMKDNGKKVIVANFENRISREMKKISDKYINLSEYMMDIKK
jgi:uncharacterized LabA/DUF88 family protein